MSVCNGFGVCINVLLLCVYNCVCMRNCNLYYVLLCNCVCRDLCYDASLHVMITDCVCVTVFLIMYVFMYVVMCVCVYAIVN